MKKKSFLAIIKGFLTGGTAASAGLAALLCAAIVVTTVSVAVPEQASATTPTPVPGSITLILDGDVPLTGAWDADGNFVLDDGSGTVLHGEWIDGQYVLTEDVILPDGTLLPGGTALTADDGSGSGEPAASSEPAVSDDPTASGEPAVSGDGSGTNSENNNGTPDPTNPVGGDGDNGNTGNNGNNSGTNGNNTGNNGNTGNGNNNNTNGDNDNDGNGGGAENPGGNTTPSRPPVTEAPATESPAPTQSQTPETPAPSNNGGSGSGTGGNGSGTGGNGSGTGGNGSGTGGNGSGTGEGGGESGGGESGGGGVTPTSAPTSTPVVTYTITWNNDDGTTLGTTPVNSGAMPTYTGATPTKTPTAQYTYTFSGWDPEPVAATANATYTAKYTSAVNQYTVTFDSQLGSAVAPQTLDYGALATEPTPAPQREGYTFDAWYYGTAEEAVKYNFGATYVTGDITLYAKWIPTFTVKLNWGASVNFTFTYQKDVNQIPILNSVSFDGKTLTEGEDYKAEYSEKSASGSFDPIASDQIIDAGTYKLTISGLGDYASEPPAEFEFVIAPAKLEKPTATGSYTYNKDPQTVTITGVDENTMTLGGVTSATNAGEYTATVTLKDNKNYCWADGSTEAVSIAWSIAKATPSVEPTPTAKTLTYEKDSEPELVNAGSTTGGTLQYSLDGSAWSATIPTGTNAGDYTVYYKVVGDANYNDVDATRVTVTIKPKDITPAISIAPDSYRYTGSAITPDYTVKDGETTLEKGTDYTETLSDNTSVGTATLTVAAKENGNYTFTTQPLNFSITKADAAVKTVPTAKTLTYTGEDQPLVNAGLTDDGTVKYSLTWDAAGSGYTEAIPTGKNAGTYTVYYMVEGDDNHNNYYAPAADGVSVTIGKAPLEKGTAVTNTTFKPPAGIDYTTNILTDRPMIHAGDADGVGTLYYAAVLPAESTPVKDTTDYSTSIPERQGAGTYTIYYYVKGDSNHEDSEVYSDVTATIDSSKLTIKTAGVTASYTYKNSSNVDVTETIYATDGAVDIPRVQITVMVPAKNDSGNTLSGVTFHEESSPRRKLIVTKVSGDSDTDHVYSIDVPNSDTQIMIEVTAYYSASLTSATAKPSASAYVSKGGDGNTTLALTTSGGTYSAKITQGSNTIASDLTGGENNTTKVSKTFSLGNLASGTYICEVAFDNATLKLKFKV